MFKISKSHLFLFLFLGFFHLSSPALALESRFVDVSSYNNHFVAIEYLASKNVIQGHPDGRFLPGSFTNRAEMVKLMVAGQGIEPDPQRYRYCFPDVTIQWFAPYVCYAKQQGWIQGYPDGNFRPGSFVNEVEAVKIVLNSFFSPQLARQTPSEIQQNLQGIEGVMPQDWFATYFAFARSKHLLEIEPPFSFVGDDFPSRGNVAELIFRSKLMKDQNWPQYHLYLHNQFFRQQNLPDFIKDRDCYFTESLEFDFLSNYLSSQYNLPKDHSKQGPTLNVTQLQNFPVFNPGYFCPLKDGSFLFSNTIFKSSSEIERHLMRFDASGNLTQDQFGLCNVNDPLFYNFFPPSLVQNPVSTLDLNTLELASCNYLKDTSHVYYHAGPLFTLLDLLDPSQFAVLESPVYPGQWGKTSGKLFLMGVHLSEVTDVATFEFVDKIYSKDSRNVFRLFLTDVNWSFAELPGANPDTFVP